MTVTSTNILTNDINVSITETTGNTTKTEVDSLGFSVSLSQGTGVGQVNGQAKVRGTIASGETLQVDFESIPKNSFGAPFTLDFNEVKGFVFNNEGTGTNDTINVNATGSNAMTGIFNGGSGNVIIKPYGTYSYFDYYGDLKSSSSNRYLYFQNNSPDGDLNYSYVVIGVTG